MEIVEQLHGCVAAVGNDDQLAIGQPVPDLEQKLPCPISRLLVPMFGFPSEPVRRRQGAESRQRPDPSDPRDQHQQHDHHPAEVAGLDEVTMAGADRGSIDAARLDLGTPAQFDRTPDYIGNEPDFRIHD